MFFIFSAVHAADLSSSAILMVNEADFYLASEKLFVAKEAQKVEDPTAIGQRWMPADAGVPSYGFTDAAYWARITLRTENDGHWFFVVPAPRLSDIQFFQPLESGGFKVVRTGIRRFFAERPYPSRKFVFPIHLKKGRDFTYYLRVSSETSLQIPVQVWRPEAFRQFEIRETLIFGLILGSHLLLFVYNLAIAFFLRSRVFFVYSGLVWVGIIFYSATYGFAYQYFWPDYPRFGLNINAVAIGLFGILGAQFVRFAIGSQHWKWTDRILRFGPILVVAPLFFLPFLSYGSVVRMMIISGVSLFIPILFAVTLGVRERKTVAWYFFSALMSFAAGAVVFAMVTLGVVPSTPLSQFGFIIGATGAITILSFALASQVRTFKIEREAAVAADRFKTEFLSVMSHEIRTPLTAMLGLAQLLTDNLPASERATYTHALKESGNRLAHLVNQVLDFSRIEEGRFTLEKGPFNLADLLKSLVDLFRPAAAAKGLSISVRSQVENPDLSGDAARLSQVLMNLIGNAIKFTERGGIIISAHTTAIADQVDQIRVHFSVADTGIGISPEKRQMIFESFVQADAGVSRRYGGSGLGLAIASRIVSLMDGRINVEENAGGGTIFDFSVVLQKASGTQIAPSITQQPKLSFRILLAEDDEINLMLVEHILNQDQHRFDSAINGIEALALLKKNEYDLALIDLQMPEMDGYTTVRQARLLANANSRIPMYALSANALPSDLAACREAGFTGHIAKPYNPEELRYIIQLAGRGEKTRATFT
jgi:two-component system, sensor histidine kinase LadS